MQYVIETIIFYKQSIVNHLQHVVEKALVNQMEHANVTVITMDIIVQVSFYLPAFGIRYMMYNQIFILFKQSIAEALTHAKVMATVIHLEHVSVKVVIMDLIVLVSYYTPLSDIIYVIKYSYLNQSTAVNIQPVKIKATVHHLDIANVIQLSQTLSLIRNVILSSMNSKDRKSCKIMKSCHAKSCTKTLPVQPAT